MRAKVDPVPSGPPLAPCPTTQRIPMDASEWSYLSEGGANLVCAYEGHDPAFTGKVLRLRKEVRKRRSADTPVDGEIRHTADVGIGEAEALADADDAFSTTVVAPLIGAEHLPWSRNVRLSPTFLRHVALRLDKERPACRRQQAALDTQRGAGVLAENLVGSSLDERALSVEIKPKWGFLPSPTYLSPKTVMIKRRHCRFCMHRHFKEKKMARSRSDDDTSPAVAHPPPAPPDYCPLDLYSSSPQRVRRAIEALWDGWRLTGGTTNNLRLFWKGRLLLPSQMWDEPDGPTKQALAEFLSTGTTTVTVGDEDDHRLRRAFSSVMARALLESSLLRRLSHLQRALDALDTEGLVKAWAAELGPDVPFGTPIGASAQAVMAEPTLAEWRSVAEEFIHLERKHEHEESLAPSPTTTTGRRPRSLRLLILAYLLSATFKDCSVFVRLSKKKSSTDDDDDDHARVASFHVNVKAVDMDPKPIGRLARYARQDAEIVRAFAEHLEAAAGLTEGRACDAIRPGGNQ